ncbi:MAG: PKD domain-containing protein [Bacteroidetes bacterium]|nr:PKD domain-containing protein [Bacteroidota bacterium]
MYYTVDRHHLLNFGTGAYNSSTNTYFQATIARVTRYTCNSLTNFTTLVPGSRLVLIGETKKTGIPVLHESHSGGSLIFGTDGSLLVSTGDGASYNFIDGGGGATYWSQAINDSIIRPEENVGSFRSQMVDCLNGKILRIDPATGNGLESNPYFSSTAPRAPRSRVWALGLRNPFRMTLRSGTGESDITAGNPGTLYIGDVGWETWEDLSANSKPKQNFGWPLYEGLTPHIGYQNADIQNPDAPNPLFGTGGCTQPFFKFDELLKQATLDPDPFFANACDTLQEVPDSIFSFIHTRPLVDWQHGFQARTGIFNGIDAAEININDPLSPLQGSMFGGYASIAGVWYDDDRFPVQWQNTYFHADYVGQWIRNFVVDSLDQPTQTQGFWDNNGVIVYMTLNRKNGCISYVNYPNEIKEICYGGIVNNRPSAILIADTTYGVGPLTVQFDGSQSTDPENLPLTYLWDFGDGNSSTLPNPAHVYNPGTSIPVSYYAKLTVFDDIGQSDMDSILISINNTPPNVQITSFNDGDLYSMSGFTNLPLEALVTDAEHSQGELFYQWRTILHHNVHTHLEEIDTNKITTTVISPIGCEATSTYFFRISLTVTDAGGLSTTVNSNLFAACDPPVSQFLVSDTVICEGENIQFTDLSTNFPVQWEWEFPGGTPAVSSDPNPSVTYNAAGAYDVILIASSFRGSDTLVLQNHILVGSLPVVTLGTDTSFCNDVVLNAGNQGATYLWNDNSVSQTLNVVQSGVYTVTVTNGSGCSNTDSIAINIFSLPVFSLGPDQALCDSTSILSAGITGVSFLWNTGDTSQSINVNTSSDYILTVTSLQGCTFTDSVYVLFYPDPILNIGADTTFCGQSLLLDAGAGFQNYLWQDGSTGSQYLVLQSGTYSIAITDSNSCSESDSIIVIVNNPPVFSLGSDTTQCGGSVQLLGPAGFPSYLWQDGSTNAQLLVQQSGIYSLVVVDSNVCTSSDTITVVINNLPIFTLGNDSVQCGGSIQLVGPSGFPSYLWQDGSTNAQLLVQQSGIYSLVVADSNGCLSSDSITVVINNLPVFTLGNDSVQCGGSIQLVGPSGFPFYLWQDGSNLQNLIVQQSGTYVLGVTDSNNCSTADSIIININSLPAFDLGQDVSICDSIYVLNSGLVGWSFLWNNGSTADSLVINSTGLYYLQVTDSNQCTFSDSINVALLTPVTASFIPGFNDTLCTTDAPFLLSGGQPAGGFYSINGVLTTVLSPLNIGAGLVAINYNYIAPNGCSDTATFELLIQVCTGIPFVKNEPAILVFPNPADDQILLNFSEQLLSKAVKLLFYDSIGKIVFEDEFIASKDKTYFIGNYPNGIYSLLLQAPGISEGIKIIIDR